MFDGKVGGATNDGKTCKAPIVGKKLTFDGKAWGATNDGKTCGIELGELLMMAKLVDPHPHLIAKLVRLQLMVKLGELPKMLNLLL